jgi:hypothetical protein
MTFVREKNKKLENGVVYEGLANFLEHLGRKKISKF